MGKIRPDGFDFNIPDKQEDRCLTCNPDGMCRTGNVPYRDWYGSLCYVGTSTTTIYAYRCPNNCFYGLKMSPFSLGEDLTP